MRILKLKTKFKKQLNKEIIDPIHPLSLNGNGSILYQYSYDQKYD